MSPPPQTCRSWSVRHVLVICTANSLSSTPPCATIFTDGLELIMRPLLFLDFLVFGGCCSMNSQRDTVVPSISTTGTVNDSNHDLSQSYCRLYRHASGCLDVKRPSCHLLMDSNRCPCGWKDLYRWRQYVHSQQQRDFQQLSFRQLHSGNE